MITGVFAAQRALARLGQELSREHELTLEVRADGGMVSVRRTESSTEFRMEWCGEAPDGIILAYVQEWRQAGEPNQVWHCAEGRTPAGPIGRLKAAPHTRRPSGVSGAVCTLPVCAA